MKHKVSSFARKVPDNPGLPGTVVDIVPVSSEFESYVQPPPKRVTIRRLTRKMRELKPGDPPLMMSQHTLMAFQQYARRNGWGFVQLKNKKLLNAWHVWRVS